ncbi:MAG TPA: enoyl-ACP reductase FabI [Solirubrobacteraceae bacterium]|jgi:enoyl ACP reductase|nr:enoyl-ACP reductase FabI [Solirubrobacteraceae bacterium]
MLQGRRILVTGVLDRHSIAFATAARAQELGAEVLLTGFGRTRRMTERAARQLPRGVDVLELDVNSTEDIERLRGELEERWGALDGLLHAVAYAPPDALGGGFMDTPLESALTAYQTSAFSLKALVAGVLPLLEAAPDGAGVVGLDFDARVAWPSYDWMGVAKAALEAVARYLAREVGPRQVRVNLVSAGPIETLAAGGIPGFSQLAEVWSRTAPLAWDTEDPGPVADAACFLLSPLARGITAEIVHVDGGFHAMGCATPAASVALAAAPDAARLP